MSREFVQRIGPWKFWTLFGIFLVLVFILAYSQEREQSPTSADSLSAPMLVPTGLSFPAVPSRVDSSWILSPSLTTTNVYSLVDASDFIQRFESGVVVTSPGNVRAADNSQAATAASLTGLIKGSYSSMPCMASLCGSGTVIHSMKTVFGNIASGSWYTGLNWLFLTADRAVMIALTAATLAVLMLPKSLRHGFLLQLQKGRIGKRDLSYSV